MKRFLHILAGLVVPALGANPVAITVAAQVSNVFVLPLTVAAALWLVNGKAMGGHRAGWLMNAALSAALVFSVCVAIAGAKSLKGFFWRRSDQADQEKQLRRAWMFWYNARQTGCCRQ